MAGRDQVVLELDGREVRLSSPDKPFFGEDGIGKLDVCEYYLSVADAILPHLRDRPTTMKRFPNGAGEDFFFQKRVPKGAPDWLESPPARRRPPRRAAHRPRPDARLQQLGRRARRRHVRARGARRARPGRLPEDLRRARDPRLRPRRAALGLHRGPPRGARARPRGGAPAAGAGDVEDFTLRTVSDRLREIGDPSAGLHGEAGTLDGLLELAARDEAEGLGDAPWPPHFRKQADEPRRVQPSKRRS